MILIVIQISEAPGAKGDKNRNGEGQSERGGRGIRTHDPNLGKVLHYLPARLHRRSKASQGRAA